MADSLPAASSPPPTKITVLISGNGSNLQALIDATTNGLLPSISIIRVISNKKGAYGLTRASNASIPTTYHNLIAGKYHKSGETDKAIVAAARERYDEDLAKIVLEDQPDLVVCAGFMHVLAPTFLQPLDEAGVPVINLHPARPGEYDGTHAIERAWRDFQEGKLERGTGIMIHYVIAAVDRGTPILVRDVPIEKGETLEELEEKIHKEEHQLIVKGTAQAVAELWQRRRRSQVAGEARSQSNSEI